MSTLPSLSHLRELFLTPFRHHQVLAEYSVALLIPILGAALSFLASDCNEASVRWRKSLKKSRLSPRPVVFIITWIVLYVIMGHSSFLVYFHQKRRGRHRSQYMILSAELMVYLVQCLLNHFYIIVLFGFQRIDLALLMIIPLWFSTLVTTIFFFDAVPLAGKLMAVVLAWISINVYFNAFLYLYNDVYTETDLDKQHDEHRSVHKRRSSEAKVKSS